MNRRLLLIGILFVSISLIFYLSSLNQTESEELIQSPMIQESTTIEINDQPGPTELTTPTPTPVIEEKIDPEPIEKILAQEEIKVSRGGNLRKYQVTDLNVDNFEKFEMRATSYDLSYESCKKNRDHPEYGITRSGRRAVFGRTVAVDPKVIPLDSVLYIIFPEEYEYLNGIYVAEDIGSGIKGKEVDIFLGEDKLGETKIAEKVDKFGVRKVTVYVLERGVKK